MLELNFLNGGLWHEYVVFWQKISQGNLNGKVFCAFFWSFIFLVSVLLWQIFIIAKSSKYLGTLRPVLKAFNNLSQILCLLFFHILKSDGHQCVFFNDL